MSSFSDPMDCSPPGSSVHGIFQARILEWAAISFSRWLHDLRLITTPLGEEYFLCLDKEIEIQCAGI